MLDISNIPIYDHHAHPLLRQATSTDPLAFQRWFTESGHPQVHERDVPHTLLYRSAIRFLAEILGCESSPAAVLEARAARPYAEWVQALFHDAGIAHVLCDYGYPTAGACSPEEMAALLPCPVQPIMRLESVAEALIMQHETFEAMVDSFQGAVARAREAGCRAFKSIAAYRAGLNITRPTLTAAQAGFRRLREAAVTLGRVRLADQALGDYLLWIALEEADRMNLPVQFHTGFGDEDADLRLANPLHLRPVIERTQAPLILLHAGWPYYRETAHLATIYPHVYLDLSLAVPFATAGIPGIMRDVLGMAPFSKVLFATDAFVMPEIYWLAARWGRWGLSRVLDEFVTDGFLTERDALEAAAIVLHANARAIYL
jgi:hypothetical protein